MTRARATQVSLCAEPFPTVAHCLQERLNCRIVSNLRQQLVVLGENTAIIVGSYAQDLPGTPCRIVGGKDC